MSFDPKMADILRYANNFFASGYAIVALVIGITIGAYAIRALVNVFRRPA